MAADFRYCSENAVFGQPEVGLGIIPGFGGTQRLARLVGMGAAKEIIYSSKNIKADEAYRIGLVNKVVPQAELMAEAVKAAKKIQKQGPVAVQIAKKLSTMVSIQISSLVLHLKAMYSDFASQRKTRRKACRPSWKT